MMAIYSWGRLPGMDVHVLEPVLIDDMPKKQMPIRVLEAVLCSIAWGYGGEWFYDVLLVSNA